MLGLMQFFMIAGAVSACYSAVLPQNQAPEVNAVTTKSEDDKKKEEQKMSEYTEELELIDYAKKLIEKSKKQLPTVASEQFLPEVLTDEEIEKKLHDFSRVFYLSKSHFKAFKSAQVKFINFETVTREEKNMGVGIRWEKVMTESGRNLIDPSRIEDPDDVRVIYVKHNNGITDFMSLPDYDIPIIDDIGDDEILDYAQGEATVIFRPGYDRLVIKKSDITRTLSLEKITCLVETIGQHHIKLIFDEKGYERPMAVAYNKDGVRLEGLEWVSYPLYANGKSVESFTPETYPDEDELEKFAFLALFSGEIDRIELFFEKDRQTRKIPIKTTQLLPDKMAWDDYKDISEWVDLPFRPHANFKTLSREKMQDSLFVQFERSEAMMGFNDPELKLHLPAIANSTFAEVWFNNLECRETPEDEFRPIRFQNRGETEIYGFKYKKTEDDEHRKKMNLIPFKSRIAGNLVVWYPQDLQWHEAGRGTSYIADDHKVVVEGGLVSYFPPEGYDLPKISEEPGYYIRAISPEGKLLDLNSSVFLLSNNNPSKGIRFGFWGQIEKLEIAVVHQWTKFESRFEAMVLPEFTENSQVNDMMAFLTEAGLLKFEVGGEKIDISTLTDKTEEDKKEKLKFTGYNVTAFVQVGKKKIKPYTWNGELPGDTAFCKSHLELLLEEVLQLVNRSKKDVYYRYRLAAPKVAFAQVNDNNRIVKQITLPDLDKQKETSDRLEKLKATLSRALEDWLVVDPAEKAELSGFSKQKIPQSHFIRELVFRNQDLDLDLEES